MNSISMLKPIGYVSDIAAKDAISGSGSQVSSSFGDAMKSALDQVNETQNKAESLQKEFQAGGDVELHQVMVAMQTATISFQTLNAARNKVVQAYQSVMNMNI